MCQSLSNPAVLESLPPDLPCPVDMTGAPHEKVVEIREEPALPKFAPGGPGGPLETGVPGADMAGPLEAVVPGADVVAAEEETGGDQEEAEFVEVLVILWTQQSGTKSQVDVHHWYNVFDTGYIS